MIPGRWDDHLAICQGESSLLICITGVILFPSAKPQTLCGLSGVILSVN